MTETIRADNNILAIIISSSYHKKGIEFFTPDQSSLQLGYMNREAGYKVEPHTHSNVDQRINTYQEVLIIRSGKVKVSLYDRMNALVARRILSSGDCILLASGGHGVEILEEAEILEIKQGPFSGDGDKVLLQFHQAELSS